MTLVAYSYRACDPAHCDQELVTFEHSVEFILVTVFGVMWDDPNVLEVESHTRIPLGIFENIKELAGSGRLTWEVTSEYQSTEVVIQCRKGELYVGIYDTIEDWPIGQTDGMVFDQPLPNHITFKPGTRVPIDSNT